MAESEDITNGTLILKYLGTDYGRFFKVMGKVPLVVYSVVLVRQG